MHEIEVYRPAKGPLGSPWRLVLATLFAVAGVWMLYQSRDWRDVLVALVCLPWFGWSVVQRAHRYILERSFVRVEPEGLTLVGIYLKPGHPEDTGRHRAKVDVLLPPDLEDVDPKELAWRLNERRLAS